MKMGKIKTLLKSGVLLDLYFFKNNKGNFIAMLIWPYLMLGLVVGMGFLFGSPSTFKKNIGLNIDPIAYFIASTVVMMASISVMWEVGGNVLFLRWLGALPYVIVAPHRMSIILVLSYVPRYLFYMFIQVVEFLPLLVLLEGVTAGIVKTLIMLLAVTVGMLPLLGFSALFASLLLIIKEESNVLNWLNPIILIFSGALYPTSLMPYWMWLVSRVLPTTYTVELARTIALIGSPELAPIMFLIGILMGLAVVYNILSYMLIGAGEKSAMKRGII